jgi:hypothetical protein
LISNISDLHHWVAFVPIFLGLGGFGVATLDGVLDVADALIGKLNKTYVT